MKKHDKTAHRIADQIRYAISMKLLRSVKDPRLGFVTITHVELNKDFRVATVYYTRLGGEGSEMETAELLEELKGTLRKEIGQHLRLRYVPELRFAYDEMLEMSYGQPARDEQADD
ncbi:MAG: 30S ribosome-binding factor RbfA [Acidobacteria bacterium]|nr:MAG: 30S ribosome-binding factor RbfA [Acidobacteriota bacterium]RLE23234.1 MAG: 30S ribosome-binding factor RbfA [Acidobacteriota bacterium]